MTDYDTLVWQKPKDARAWHLYDRDDKRSLCGNYRLDDSEIGKRFRGFDDVEASDSYEAGRDCKNCCRRADLLDEDGGEATA